MKKKEIIIISLFLLFLSFLIYFIHYLIFHNLKYIFSYFLLHLAFVPIEVLLITIIVEKVLEHREKYILLEKLNMVIGAFFNAVGDELLKIIVKADKNNIKDLLNIDDSWDLKKYNKVKDILKNYNFDIYINKIDLCKLKNLLERNREFLLRLLENPILLEHEDFTELLLAVFHLADELHKRENLNNLPEEDLEHLKNDILRVYKMLVIQWINYLIHLKENYPYLYSLCVRANPFNKKSVIIGKK